LMRHAVPAILFAQDNIVSMGRIGRCTLSSWLEANNIV